MKSKIFFPGMLMLVTALGVGCGHHRSDADADSYVPHLTDSVAPRADVPSAAPEGRLSVGGDVDLNKAVSPAASEAPAKADVAVPTPQPVPAIAPAPRPDTPAVPTPVPAPELPKVKPEAPGSEPSVKPEEPSVKPPAAAGSSGNDANK